MLPCLEQRRSIVTATSSHKRAKISHLCLRTHRLLRCYREGNKSKKERLSAAISDQREAEDKAVHDLRVWCEKSMTAMEKSYENLLNELQIQHGKEKDSLKREKEQALAEETKATLSALDAMRKAHESEVQKEVDLVLLHTINGGILVDHTSDRHFGWRMTNHR